MDVELRSDEVLSSYQAGPGLTATDLDRPDPAADHRSWKESAGVVLLAGALLIGTTLALGGPQRSSPSPASSPPTAPVQVAELGLACRMPGITCGQGRIRVAGPMSVPVSFVPVAGVDTDDIAASRWGVEVRRTEGSQISGLRVVESPVAADGTTRGVRALVGAGARRLARWLSTRPFVAPTTPEAITLDGVHGYRVAVRLREGAVLPGFDESRSAGVTFLNHGRTGRGETTSVSNRARSSYYYLLDLPGHGVVLVWVWTWDGGSQDLAAMDAMVESVRFG